MLTACLLSFLFCFYFGYHINFSFLLTAAEKEKFETTE